MLKRIDVELISNPQCCKPVDDLEASDFNYLDKDGFELNIAEQKFYKAMGHPIHYPILNHCCWQEPWYEVEGDTNLLIDHAMILHRCNYIGKAKAQLSDLAEIIPYAKLLLQTQQKWGYDFALDAVSADGSIFEVLHIEYDNYDYQKFRDAVITIEYKIKHTDWVDAAERVWKNRHKWQDLRGFEQNHWKAQFLLGWSKSEYLEKAV